MQSYIEVDEEDLYALKINCKEEKNSRKGKQRNKCRKNNNRFKIFLKREKEKKEYSTELQKPNVGAEVYNNNKKCD